MDEGRERIDSLSAFTRILQATSAWTVDSLLDDPRLDQLITRLAVDDRELALLMQARSALLWSGALELAPRREVVDWRSGLEKILAFDPPRLEVAASASEWARVPSERILATSPKRSHDDAVLYPQTPSPLVLLDRDDEYVSVRSGILNFGHQGASFVRLSSPPTQEQTNAWCQEILSSDEPNPWSSERIYPHLDWAWTEHPIQREGAALLWTKLDLELGLVWLGLRCAAQRGDGVRLHDGRILLSIGNGVVVVLHLREAPGAGESVRAAIVHRGPPEGYEDRWRDQWMPRMTESSEVHMLRDLIFLASEMVLRIEVIHSTFLSHLQSEQMARCGFGPSVIGESGTGTS